MDRWVQLVLGFLVDLVYQLVLVLRYCLGYRGILVLREVLVVRLNQVVQLDLGDQVVQWHHRFLDYLEFRVFLPDLAVPMDRVVLGIRHYRLVPGLLVVQELPVSLVVQVYLLILGNPVALIVQSRQLLQLYLECQECQHYRVVQIALVRQLDLLVLALLEDPHHPLDQVVLGSRVDLQIQSQISILTVSAYFLQVSLQFTVNSIAENYCFTAYPGFRLVQLDPEDQTVQLVQVVQWIPGSRAGQFAQRVLGRLAVLDHPGVLRIPVFLAVLESLPGPVDRPHL